MKRTIEVLLLLYVMALHCSIAAMEMLSWALVGLIVAWRWRSGEGFKVDRWGMAAFSSFLLAVLMSLLVNPELKPFWFQLGFMRFGVLLFAMTWVLDTLWSAEFERRLVGVWLFCVAVVGAYAIFQCLTGIDLIRPGSGALAIQSGDVYKAPAFFSISLTFAYVFGTSLGLISLPSLRIMKSKWVAMILLIGLAGFVASMSRGAWLTMILAAGFYLAVERRRWVLPFVGVVAVVAAGLTIFTHGFGDKILNMLQLKVDHSSAMRLDIWRGYWQLFLDSPIFGIGLFQGDNLLPGAYERLGIQQDFISHAHNNFLQILAGCGVVGEVTFLWLIGLYFVRAWKLRGVSVWGWSALIGLSFVFLGGLTEANFIDAEVNHMILFTWALVAAVSGKATKFAPTQTAP